VSEKRPSKYESSLSTLVDWADFEEFVKKLYGTGEGVTVERNVEVIGKSGAKRQIDVRFTLVQPLHTYVTIAECKRWKDPVTRQEIDVLAATVEDVGAQKGALFTTKGFEDGAEKYAKSKSIDLYLVRDLTDEEWGLPGRHVRVILHTIVGQLEGVHFPRATKMGPSGWQPEVRLTLSRSAPAEKSDETLLYAPDGTTGPSLEKTVLTIRDEAIKRVGNAVPMLPDEGREQVVHTYATEVRAILSEKWPFREIRFPGNKSLIISEIRATACTHVIQEVIERDRGKGLDLAVALEDYLTGQRKRAVLASGDSRVSITDIEAPKKPSEPAVVNGSILKVATHHLAPLALAQFAPESVTKTPMLELNLDAAREDPPATSE